METKLMIEPSTIPNNAFDLLQHKIGKKWSDLARVGNYFACQLLALKRSLASVVLRNGTALSPPTIKAGFNPCGMTDGTGGRGSCRAGMADERTCPPWSNLRTVRFEK